jgi:predicted dehydrogenase
LTIHVGILGGGGISDTHARAVQAAGGAQVVAVAGQNAEKVRVLADRYGARAYAETESLLRHRPLDAVLIGSPSGLHAEQGIAAARRGLHVLVEKPVDATVAKAEELVSECAAAGVKLGVFFQDRFAPGVESLKAAIEGGALGRPLLVSARVRWWRPPEYYASSRWRGTRAFDGGGALINQAIHTVDLLLWLLGDVDRVSARAKAALHPIEVEDTLVAILELRNGALATLEATTAAYPGFPRVIEISGSEGTVVLRQERVVRADLRTPAPGLVEAGSAADEGARARSPLVADESGHAAVFRDFVRSIHENGEPRCSGPEGLRSLRLVEALYLSANEGRVVGVS